MARQTGELVLWNDERGFGFIVGDDGQRRFVHIKAIGRIATRPRAGDRVSFTAVRGSDGRLAARDVQIAGANPLNREASRRGAVPVETASDNWALSAGAGLIVMLAFSAHLFGPAPLWLPVGYLMLGVASIVTYWFDKRAAETGRWRVSERSLHTIDLIGGIAGGLLAQQLLRHKTSKPSFAGTTLLIALLHIAGLVTLLVLGISGQL
jgi:uncharacterized membrane protein YsdA (DUF1294 family)/cold shock CspA family protein